MNSIFSPGDVVTWFKGKGANYRGKHLIKAEVWYRVKKKWAIRFKNRVGDWCVRYVDDDQIEKGLRPGALEFF